MKSCFVSKFPILFTCLKQHVVRYDSVIPKCYTKQYLNQK